MKKKLAIGLCIILLSILSLCFNVSTPKASGASASDWNKTYGSSGSDYANSVVQTTDGGYALAGWTGSSGVDHVYFMLVKTDSSGNQQWVKTYGGSSDCFANSVVLTTDGGYALAGFTGSSGVNHASFMLVKTDSSGNQQWAKTYGGSSDCFAYSIVQTSDGGYALVGWTGSYNYGAGNEDFMLVKTDSAGNQQWTKTYGDSGLHEAFSVVQTADGGYALAGWTDFGVGAGNEDFVLVKTDSSGNQQWTNRYGGIGNDRAFSVVQTSDGGYALAGYTATLGVGGGMGDLLVKTDSSGNQQWTKTYGGDSFKSVVQTSDGGYALAGLVFSSSTSEDFWLVKTDSAGNQQWSKTYGGTNNDHACSLVQTSDGGYAIGGWTDSSTGHDTLMLVKVSNVPQTSSTTTNEITGIENVVTFNDWNTVGSGPFSIQQNFYLVSGDNSQTYWVQNLVMYNPVLNIMNGGFEIYNFTAGAPDFPANKLVMWWFTANYATETARKEIILRSTIENNHVVMENTFHNVWTWNKNMIWDFELDEGSHIESNWPGTLNAPQLVIVGTPYPNQDVTFDNPAGGKVDSYVRVGSSAGTWYYAENKVAQISSATKEASHSLQWNENGNFQYLAGATDQGLNFGFNEANGAVSPPVIQFASQSTVVTIFALHCPAEMSLYDSAGSHVGLNVTTGKIDTGLPKSMFVPSGGDEYILVFDPSGTYRVAVTGTDSGTYTLELYNRNDSGISLVSSSTQATQKDKIDQHSFKIDAEKSTTSPSIFQNPIIPIIVAVLIVVIAAVVIISKKRKKETQSTSAIS